MMANVRRRAASLHTSPVAASARAMVVASPVVPGSRPPFRRRIRFYRARRAVPTGSLREADVLVDHAGEAEGPEVGQPGSGGGDVGSLEEGERVDLAPDGGVDLVGEVEGLLL